MSPDPRARKRPAQPRVPGAVRVEHPREPGRAQRPLRALAALDLKPLEQRVARAEVIEQREAPPVLEKRAQLIAIHGGQRVEQQQTVAATQGGPVQARRDPQLDPRGLREPDELDEPVPRGGLRVVVRRRLLSIRPLRRNVLVYISGYAWDLQL